MHAGEIVIHEVEADHRRVILQFFREGICEPREPTHRHAHCQILTLDVGRADVLWIRRSADGLRHGTEALGRAVARLVGAWRTEIFTSIA